MKSLLGLLLGACCAALIACASAGKQAAMSPPPSVNDSGAAPMGPRDPRIVDLDRQIEEDLAKLDIARPRAISPASATPADVGPTVSAAGDPDCHPGPSDVCRQSCDLSDAICKASTKICTIAHELGNDAWANDRCASGKASCDTAHAKCCGCQ
jgi:hypothetical protein